MGPRMSGGDEEGPIRRGLTLEALYDGTRLRLVNRGGEPIRIDRVIVEYTLKALSYDRRELCKDRRVVEELRAGIELLPHAEFSIRMRDVEKLEKVCVEVGEVRECYQPRVVGEEEGGTG